MTSSLADDLGIVPLSHDDPRVTTALFTFREAASYLDVPLSTLAEWTRHHELSEGQPLIRAFDAEPGVASLPFVGLAEAYVLAAFRRAGVPLRKIKPALRQLKNDVGLEYALASGHLYTDGVEVLFDYVAKGGDDVMRHLTEPHSKQLVLREVVAGYLRRVQWDNNRWAERLHLPGFRTADVIVDVRRAYGRPVLTAGDARVEDLVGRWLGGDSLRDIAQDFGVPASECEDAIRVGVQPLQPRAA